MSSLALSPTRSLDLDPDPVADALGELAVTVGRTVLRTVLIALGLVAAAIVLWFAANVMTATPALADSHRPSHSRPVNHHHAQGGGGGGGHPTPPPPTPPKKAGNSPSKNSPPANKARGTTTNSSRNTHPTSSPPPVATTPPPARSRNKAQGEFPPGSPRSGGR